LLPCGHASAGKQSLPQEVLTDDLKREIFKGLDFP
jgi:hypothetical protein